MPNLKLLHLLSGQLRAGRTFRRFPKRAVARALCLLTLLFPLAATAGVMTRDDMVRAFPAPLTVGEKDTEYPVWPLFKQEATETVLAGYAFESIDLAPIPGFGGTPFNLLVAIDAQGAFLGVRVLSQHEPVFLDGLGEEPLLRFVEQYEGLSLTQNIKIVVPPDRAGNRESHIDGIAKATASVRILNQSLLSSALRVARARLGFAGGRDPGLVARIKPDVFEPMDWQALRDAGLITRKVFKNGEIEAAFRGTVGEGRDPEAAQHPGEDFIELHAALLSVPSVGRNLLPPEGWQYVQDNLGDGDHVLLVVGRGRYSFLGDDFLRGTVPERLALYQGGLPIEIRDLDLADSLDLFDLDYKLKLPPALAGAEWRAFHVIAQSGLDPARPLDIALKVTRTKGWLYPEKVTKDFVFPARLPERYFEAAGEDNKTWHSIWSDRAGDIAVLLLGLAVLTLALGRQGAVTGNPRRLELFRTGYLLFTLVFIGWHAQGQLSIVNITALIQSVIAGRGLEFFLYDPMTVLLWAFVVPSLLWWGRGTFCGWLCPFGALQELAARLAKALGVPRLRLSDRLDARLKLVKYGVLAAIVASAAVSVPLTDRLVEVEPFKTSITLMFVRSWPFVAWAAGLILLTAFLYKGFCRYLCPLGAGMALLGRFRLSEWIPRRAECGQPCQRCRHSCAYQAIGRGGAIDYAECFQCLDCVAIYRSDALCVPLILQQRKARRAAPAQPDVPPDPQAAPKPAPQGVCR